MQPFLVISALVTTYLCYVEGQSSCSTPNGGRGTCRSVKGCVPLWALVNNQNRTQEDVDFLRKSHCGFQNKTAQVCCSDTCLTPDGKEGQCISINSCPHLAKPLLNKPVPQNIVDYIRSSRCDGVDKYSVCCGPSSELETSTTHRCSGLILPPAPSSRCCGEDYNTGNKLASYGGVATAIDAYPWLALIEYKSGNSIKTSCGASLISARYVLTAGHCVIGDVLNIGTPVNIRLGEYNTTNEGPDCVEEITGHLDCTEGTTVIPIEKIIPHPEYDPYHSEKRHDIALIRMMQLAPYTYFIRPICLPETELAPSPRGPLPLFTAGWGAVNETYTKSSVKAHVDVPLVSNDICQTAYRKPKRNVTITSTHLCAGGQLGKDSCKGDSGGPLMFLNKRFFEVVGVVSFGSKPCGLEHVPGVYTKVLEYNSWIRSVIKP